MQCGTRLIFLVYILTLFALCTNVTFISVFICKIQIKQHHCITNQNCSAGLLNSHSSSIVSWSVSKSDWSSNLTNSSRSPNPSDFTSSPNPSDFSKSNRISLDLQIWLISPDFQIRLIWPDLWICDSSRLQRRLHCVQNRYCGPKSLFLCCSILWSKLSNFYFDLDYFNQSWSCNTLCFMWNCNIAPNFNLVPHLLQGPCLTNYQSPYIQ